MATWAIGDVQGCFRTLERLLERVGPASTDDLVLVGDLVNRGTGSLEALRWAVRQPRLRVVLGNHDLHLLGLAAGVRRPKGKDTLGPVLTAKDRGELLDWLGARPLLLRLDVGGRPYVVVHAGLLPAWDAAQAARLADEVQAALAADRAAALEVLFADEEDLAGAEARVRGTAAALTRLRTIGPDGAPDWEFNGAPPDAPRGRRPWFEVPGRRSADGPVVFGHWAALGLHLAPNVLALDSGCVWGRSLTAVRLDDRSVVQEPTVRADLP